MSLSKQVKNIAPLSSNNIRSSPSSCAGRNNTHNNTLCLIKKHDNDHLWLAKRKAVAWHQSDNVTNESTESMCDNGTSTLK